jgi:Tfp pilus assembly protein PilF
MKQYEAALQRDPDNVAAHVFLGDSYLKLGKQRQAASEYQAALALDPNEYQARFKLERLQRA